MSDDDLIARLRSNIFGTGTAMLASDRIEDLTKERDSLLSGHRALNIGGARLQDRAETAEAKLAKAVGALKNLTDCVDNGCFCSEMQMASAMDIARATLAEIKGESHE